MKATIRTILNAVAVMLATASCQKLNETGDIPADHKETIDIRISGLMGEYSQVDATKSELVNTVRVSWKGGETVYVYDGTKYLGSLVSSLEGDEDRYALLSTDGEQHKIAVPTAGTTKLTLVHGPSLTEAPAISEGVVSISLSNQSSPKVPFVAYATLDYNNETAITNLVVPFKFATSVIKVNCTGLKANTAITSATLSNVNTACKLTLSGTDAPTITGYANGTIVKTGDDYFAAGKVNAEGEAVFQIAVPKLETASKARFLTVIHGTEGFKDKKFTKNSLNPATSVNTVCQMVALPAGALPREFTVDSKGTKVHFSKGNLQATYNGTTYTWDFAEHQYDSVGGVPGNTTIDRQANGNVVDLFGWSTNDKYGIKPKTDTDYSGDFKDWGEKIGDGITWRTLSKDEWTYLFNNHPYKWASVNSVYGFVLAPDGFTGTLSDSYADDAALATNNLLFLPAAGRRDGSGVDNVGSHGYYWSSTHYDSDHAYNVYFRSSSVNPHSSDYRRSGYSVRLITESK